MKNKKIIIVIGIVLILVVCFVGYYIHLNSNSMEKSLEKDGYTMLDIDKLETKLEFTGELRDYRNENYYEELKRVIETAGVKEKIKITKQIADLKKECVINGNN